MRTVRTLTMLGLILGMVQTTTAQEGRPKELKTIKTYDLGKLPKGQNGGPTFHGLILNEKSLAQLWKSWERDPAKKPEVDFKKHMLYVSAQDTGDPNNQWHSFRIDAGGTLDIVTGTTLIGGGQNTGVYRAKLLLLNRADVTGVKAWVRNAKSGSYQAIPLPGELNSDAEPKENGVSSVDKKSETVRPLQKTEGDCCYKYFNHTGKQRGWGRNAALEYASKEEFDNGVARLAQRYRDDKNWFDYERARSKSVEALVKDPKAFADQMTKGVDFKKEKIIVVSWLGVFKIAHKMEGEGDDARVLFYDSHDGTRVQHANPGGAAFVIPKGLKWSLAR